MNTGETPKWRQDLWAGDLEAKRQLEVERAWRSLVEDDRQDADTDELRRLFFGSALC